jgi:hypothetical protein
MKEVPSGATPVNPMFRAGLLSMGCGLSWTDVYTRDDFYVNYSMGVSGVGGGVGGVVGGGVGGVSNDGGCGVCTHSVCVWRGGGGISFLGTW